jgi:ABC-2 type transport system ATP-binding protein
MPVQSVQIVPSEGQARQHLQITTEGPEDPGREIAAIVVGAGLGLYEMRRRQVSLEDVFLQLTTMESAASNAFEDGDAIAPESQEEAIASESPPPEPPPAEDPPSL